MNWCPHEEEPCVKRLLWLKLTADLKGNPYIRYIAKDSGNLFGFLQRSSKYLTLHTLLYLYKYQIKAKIRYCWDIWAGSSLSRFDRVQKCLRFLVGNKLYSTLQHPSNRRDLASHSLLYQGKWLKELYSWVAPCQTFTIRTRHATNIVANHPYCKGIQSVEINSTQTFSHTGPLFCGADSQVNISLLIQS